MIDYKPAAMLTYITVTELTEILNISLSITLSPPSYQPANLVLDIQ